MRGKKNTPEFIEQEVLKIHHGIVYLDPSTYTKMKGRARFVDKDYGEWWTTAKSVLKGSGHPCRGAKKSITSRTAPIFEVKGRVQKIHGSVLELDDNTYVSMDKNARFVDIDYGEFWCRPSDVIRKECGHPLRGIKKRTEALTYTIEEIKKRLFKVHGDILRLDESTYVCTNSKARFVDSKYGEWWGLVTNAINGKQGHPERGRLKGAKKLGHTYIKFHWKTGEELVCKGTWESKTVDFLNNRRINFKWQPKAFKTDIMTNCGNISTYHPDLYLEDEDKWVEIKGWMRPLAKPKWDWFKTQFPTAELWDKKKLKEMNIL
jgi:hypothetical protein